MEIDINEVIAGYNSEIAKLTQRAILAEVQLRALQGGDNGNDGQQRDS